MKQYTWRQWAYIVAAIGCLQFFVLTILGMVFFPGGNRADLTAVGYNFWHNFFSDLGGTVTPSNLPNPISSVLFFVALATIGIVFIPFLIALPGVCSNSRIARYFSYIGTGIGIFSATCYVGIAFTPWNIALAGHIFFVQSAFLSIVPVALFYAIAMFLEKGFPKRYAIVFVIFTCILIASVLLMFLGPKSTTPEGLIIQAVGQKVVVYSEIICFAIQAYGALQVSDQKIIDSGNQVPSVN